MTNTHDGEYLAGPQAKGGISRARKGMIAMLVVGALVALGGAGTFASFSASTTNDASFSTENLVMINNGTCRSDGGLTGEVIDNTGGANSNDSSCGTLFTATEDEIGTLYTKNITIQNGGDEAHNFFLWNTGVCVSTASVQSAAFGDGDLCGAARISIERSGPTGGAQDCVYPAADTGACEDITDGVSGDTIANLPTTFATKLAVTSSTVAGGSTATYVLKVYVPHHTTCGSNPYNLDNTGATSTAAYGDSTPGLFNTSGVSCDNHYINKKAELLLKWWMESAN